MGWELFVVDDHRKKVLEEARELLRFDDERGTPLYQKGLPLKNEVERTGYSQGIITNGKLTANFCVQLGSAYCNHSCLFCPQSISKPKENEWLEMSLLEKVLKEMPDIYMELFTSSYSEPILAPNLIDALKLIKKIRPKYRVTLASNGSVFREDVFIELMKHGLDVYQFSFDAANREDYKTLMQVDHFNLAWKNLERIVELKKKMNSNISIRTHIMHFKGVEKDFEKFKDYWQDKVDHVVLRSVHNFGRGSYDLAKQLKDNGFESVMEVPSKRYPCNQIFTSFKLKYNGKYGACLGAYSYTEEETSYWLGDAREITWMDAWQKMKNLRQAHMEGRWNDYDMCKTCNLWAAWPNMWEEREPTPDNPKRFYLNVDHME